MIKNTLKIVLAERDISIRKLSEMTGVRYATLYAFAKNKVSSVNYKVLDKICDVLNIMPGDILVFTQVEKENILCESMKKTDTGT